MGIQPKVSSKHDFYYGKLEFCHVKPWVDFGNTGPACIECPGLSTRILQMVSSWATWSLLPEAEQTSPATHLIACWEFPLEMNQHSENETDPFRLSLFFHKVRRGVI